MANNQCNLNGAYYKPPIQPPVKTHHSHARRGGDGGGLVSTVCTILVLVAIILGILAAMFWFLVRPYAVTFQVTEANLTRFDLDPLTNNLHYNISLNFSIRNPNKHLGIHYDQIEARGYYGDQRFAAVNMTSFYQESKNTTVVGTEFDGQSLVLFGHGGRSDYLREGEKSGVYRIDVKLRFKVRFDYLFFKSWALRPKIKCHLKVPLSSSTSPGGFQFHPTKCHVDL